MPELPYPGLRPFHPDETHIYFGRDTQTDALLNRLGGSRFLAVIGPSGCGKSSLVNTGLIASLELGLLVGAGERWQVVRMQPRGEPLHNLAEALVASGAVQSAASPHDDPVAAHSLALWVQSTLLRGPLGLQEVFHSHPLAANTNLLIVVDQFEEIFRYRRMISQDEADSFVALLLRSVALTDLPVYVVITMRSDFLGDCTVFPGLPETINEGQFLTPRLTREEIKEAIEGPAGVFGCAVEPELTSRLLNALGSGDDHLPVLQHALMRIWTLALERSGIHDALLATGDEGYVSEQAPSQPLGLDLYQAVGGLAGALSNHADAAFNDLDEAQRKIARYLFTALTERTSGYREIRRPVTVKEVAEIVAIDAADVMAVVDHFRRADRSFIVPSQSEQARLKAETQLDISHESLIRQWKRLAGWVEEEARAARTYQRLAEAAEEWRNRQRGLLDDIQLALILQWKANRRPNPAWARRYGGSFDLAMEMLDASEAARDERIEAEQAARERQRKQEEDRLRREQDLHVEREKTRYQRKINRLTRIAWVVTGALTVAAAWGWLTSWQETRLAEDLALAKNAQLIAQDAVSRNLHTKGMVMTLAAHLAQGPDQAEATSLLLQGLLNYEMVGRVDQGEEGRINEVVFDHQGRYAALAGRTASTNKQYKGVVVVRELADWRAPPTRLYHAQESVTSVAFAPDDARLATGSWDGRIRIWNWHSEKELASIEAQDDVLGIEFANLSGIGDFLISTGQDAQRQPAEALLWRIDDDSTVMRPQQLSNEPRVLNLAYTSDRGIAVLLIPSQADQGESPRGTSALIWDVANDAALSPPFEVCANCAGRQDLQTLALSEDGRFLATQSGDHHLANNAIVLWDIIQPSSPKRLAHLRGHEDRILSMRFRADTEQRTSDVDLQLASGSRNGEVLLWHVGRDDIERVDVSSRNDGLPVLSPKFTLKAQNDWVRSLAFHPRRAQLLSSSNTDSILWSVGRKQLLSTRMSAHTDEVWSIAANRQGLVSGTRNGEVRVWTNAMCDDPASVTVLDMQPMAAEGVTTMAMVPSDGSLALADAGGRRIRFWQADAWRNRGDEDNAAIDLDWTPWGMAFSPSGTRIAISGVDGQLAVFDSQDQAWLEKAEIRVETKAGKTGKKDWVRTVTDWDQELAWRLTGWGDNLAFSEDGEQLFFGVEEKEPQRGALRRYSVKGMRLSATGSPEFFDVGGDVGEVYSVVFKGACGASGQACLVTAGKDNDISIWRRDGQGAWARKRQLPGHRNRISSVDISPDGKTIASGSRDKSVRLWDITSGKEISSIHHHASHVNWVKFSEDGKWLFSASDDHRVVRFNVDFRSYPALICDRVGRNLTCKEWRELDTGDARYLKLCPKLMVFDCAAESS